MIEEEISEALPVRKTQLLEYIEGELAAKLYQIPEQQLVELVMESPSVHGVLLSTGPFFVHPDGLQAALVGLHRGRIRRNQRYLRRYQQNRTN